MEDIINMHQRKLDNYLLTFKYSHTSNFNTCIRPLVNALLSELTSFPPRTIIHSPIDIYTETITCYIIDNYYKNNIPTSLPHECYILMLLRYPFFINILQCQRTFKEYITFRESLLDTLDTMFPNKYSSSVKNLEQILSTKIEDVYDIRTCSIIHYFHYFINFRFDKDLVAINASKLPSGNDICYFIIHLSYNISNTNALILYHENPRIRDKFINIDNISKYKCIEKPSHIYKSQTPFITTDCNFDQHEGYKPKVYILLCYDDAKELKDCHYTIALYGKDGYVNEEFITDFIEGKLPFSLTKTEIENQINMIFLKSFADDHEPQSLLMKECEAIRHIAAEAFDKVHENGMNDITLFDTFIKHIMNDKRLLNILDEIELPFFKIYLYGMMNIYSDNLSSSSLKTIVCDYVNDYIYNNYLKE